MTKEEYSKVMELLESIYITVWGAPVGDPDPKVCLPVDEDLAKIRKIIDKYK